jgi:hypothetical protein
MGHIAHRRDDTCMQSFKWENVKGRRYLRHPDLMTILTAILDKYVVRIWTGFICMRFETFKAMKIQLLTSLHGVITQE